MGMDVLPTCMSLYHMHAWCPQWKEEGNKLSGAAIRHRCELRCLLLRIKP